MILKKKDQNFLSYMTPQKIHENDNIVVPMFSNYKGRCSNYQMCECLNLSTVYCEVALDVAN